MASNPWGAPWQPQPYYPQPPHPHVYVPPQAYPPYQQPYARAPYWADPNSWNVNPGPAPAPAPPAPSTSGGAAAPAPAAAPRSQYPRLNPLLAADTTLVRFDVREPPRASILATTFHTHRLAPALAGAPVRHVRLVARAFPWTIDIIPQAGAVVTCELVWDALHVALLQPLADSEWALIVGHKKLRETVEKAAKKRQEKEGGRIVKRIDYLGEATMFKGLERDEEFENMRLLPGGEACPETWVVKMGS